MEMEVGFMKKYEGQKLTSATMKNLGFVMKRTGDDEMYWYHRELEIEWFYLPTAGQLFEGIVQKVTSHVISLVEQV